MVSESADPERPRDATTARSVLDALRLAADSAGALLRRLEPRTWSSRDWARGDLDHRLEEAILTVLDARLGAGAVVIAEESGATAAVDAGDLVIYVDPLDGTAALRAGWPQASVALAASRDGRWLAALVETPLVAAPNGAPDRIEWCHDGPIVRCGRVMRPRPPRHRTGRALIAPRQEWAHGHHRRLLAPAVPEACASTAWRMARAAVGDVAVSVDWLPRGCTLSAWDVAVGLALTTVTGAVVRDETGRDLALEGTSLSPRQPRLLVSGMPTAVERVRRRYARSRQMARLDRLFESHLRQRRIARRTARR